MQDQRRSLDVLCPLERRTVPIQIKLLEYITAKVAFVSVSPVASPVVADEVHHAPERDRRLEHVRVAYNPVGHVPAVASAGHSQPVAIDPRILLQDRLNAVHHILVVFATPLAYDATLELLAVAGRASRVCEEHRPAARGIHLKLVKPIDAVHSGGSSVNAEDHRVLLSFLPADGLDEEAVDIPSVSALVTDALDLLKLELTPKRVILSRQLSFVLTRDVRDVKIVKMFEVVCGIDHPSDFVGDFHASNRAWPGGYPT